MAADRRRHRPHADTTDEPTAETSWIDLTQPFDADVPHSPALPKPAFETIRGVDRDGVNARWIGTPTHVGTHVDAPRHAIEDGATIDDLPLSLRGGDGAPARFVAAPGGGD